MRVWLIIAGVLGFLSVAIGAYGAHGLKSHLVSAGLYESFDTGVRYHMYHTLALLGVAWLASRGRSKVVTAAGICFVAGVLIFSGSIYVLCLTGQRGLGAITPVGGLLFLAGWILIAVAGARQR
jgi:uncharacterized membrane protein YgdD (TMEM256/DUF423 family)